jgi:amino acid adenylation domain-containing protein
LAEGKLRYRAPGASVEPSVLERLRQYKETLTAQLNEPEGIPAMCPLSHGQHALWFLWRVAPGGTAYNLSLSVPVPEGLSSTRTRRICRQLLRSHPALRSVFPLRSGAPVQIVGSEPSLDWQAVDSANWSAQDLKSDLALEHARPFNLESGPIVRFRFYEGAEVVRVLLVTMHHIVSDGWSTEVIRRQLTDMLNSPPGDDDAGPEPDLPAYHCYVRWQREVLGSEVGDRLWRFWRAALANLPPPLALPTDHPRPEVKQFQGSTVVVLADSALTAQLRALAREKDVTLFVLLAAAFLSFLHRWSGQDDIVIGVPQNGRTRPEFENVVGYFVDPLVIRSRQEPGGERFSEVLNRVQRGIREALDNAGFPFPFLVEKLNPPRYPGHSPLFDATFQYLPVPASRLEDLEMTQGSGKFDVSVTALDSGSELNCAFAYDRALFDEGTVSRAASHWIELLRRVVSDSELELNPAFLHPSRTGMPDPVLQGPSVELRSADFVLTRFRQCVRDCPDAPAVVAGGEIVRYAELAERADRLEKELREHGVTRGSVVGLAASRSAAFPAGLLAIWQAGAAYLPFDTEATQEIGGSWLDRAGASVCIWGEDVRKRQDLPNAQLETPDDPSDALAYVLFTSGTTGKSKGVAVTHCALANYVRSMEEHLQISPGSSFALVSALTADLGNTMLFPSLCTGGCLHILSDEVRLSGPAFRAYLERTSVDYLKMTPSHLAALAAESRRIAGPLRALVLGGEGVSRDWVHGLRRALPPCRIYNHYGPTEATVGVATALLEDCPPAAGTATLPLSRAVHNTGIYLLNASGQPVETGEVGELYIGGACLATGYLGDNEATRRSFIPLPGAAPGSRTPLVYRTGDLARRLEDGIEIVGRRDRQVKVRGFRVELDGVEAALRSLPEIRQCAVLAGGDSASMESLTAYVELSGTGEARSESALRGQFRRMLPPPMVPDRIEIVSRIPIGGNGKLDRTALRERKRSAAGTGAAVPPRDFIELRLADIWRELLGTSTVRPEDDFFLLGGHSLLAVRLAGRIHSEWGIDLPLAALLTHSTLERLASVLRSASQGSIRGATLVPLQPRGNTPPLYFFPGAGGNCLYFHPVSRRLQPERRCLGFQMLGIDQTKALPETIERVAEEYVGILQEDDPGPYALVGHSFGALVAYAVCLGVQRAGGQVAFLGLLDNPAPGYCTPPREPRSESQWLRHIGLRIGKLYRVAPEALVGDDSAQLNTGSFMDGLIANRLIPEDANRSAVARWVEGYKNSVKAAGAYNPDPMPCPVLTVLFRAAEHDPDMGERPGDASATWGWNRLLPGPVGSVTVPGSHLSMFAEPHVQALAAALSRQLQDASFPALA